MCQITFQQTTDKLLETNAFICCYRCEELINDTELCIEEIAKQSTKGSRMLEPIKAAKQEWLANKENESKINFKREEIYEETRQVSELEERFSFKSQEKFKKEIGLFPDDVGLDQIRVLNRKGKEIVGIAIDNLNEHKDLLVRISTQSALVHRKPVFRPNCYSFKAQLDDFFIRKKGKRAQCLGFKNGNEYKAKFKTCQAFREDGWRRVA